MFLKKKSNNDVNREGYMAEIHEELKLLDVCKFNADVISRVLVLTVVSCGNNNINLTVFFISAIGSFGSRRKAV